jgi:hypothetical protein
MAAATASSQSVHRLESVEESLTGRHGLETPRGSQSIAGRDVAALDGFDGLASRTMEAGPNVLRAGQVLLANPDVGLMVIGDDGRRLGLGGRPGAAEECWAEARSRRSGSSTSTRPKISRPRTFDILVQP